MAERKIIWGDQRPEDRAVKPNIAHKIRWHSQSSNEPYTGNTRIRWGSKREIDDQNSELPIDRYQCRLNNQTLELWRQRDEHQCGPCSIHNLSQALGDNLNFTVSQLRNITYQHRDRNGQILDIFHFDLLDIEDLLKIQFNRAHVRVIKTPQQPETRLRLLISNPDHLRMIRGMILNLGGNHWVTYIRSGEEWYRVDSLNNRGFEPISNVSETFQNLQNQSSEYPDYGVAIIDPNLDNTRRIANPNSIRFHRD